MSKEDIPRLDIREDTYLEMLDKVNKYDKQKEVLDKIMKYLIIKSNDNNKFTIYDDILEKLNKLLEEINEKNNNV